MEASYCLCGQPYDPNIFMIQCDACKDWFHSSCINFQEHLAVEIDKYHCPRCTELFGPSVYKPYRNWHRHDFWDDNANSKPVQTGTSVFIRELQARHFASEGEVVLHMKGQQITETLLQENGFETPIVVDGKDGLDMTLPSDNFNLYDIEAIIGGDKEIDVIDVTRQTNLRMKLSNFIEYFNSTQRSRIFNCVSLEFSNTALGPLVEAPLVARKLDWVNTVWPRDYPIPKPQVSKYCLMSVKDSYTDFHIDFGGSSVWYHVLKGEKIFYLIPPTSANLTLYSQWMTSTNQSETFFGDQVDQCFKCILRKGQTMIIPTGWIHAVLTPIDSLVFGGNFLQSFNIPMQLSVYEIEKKIKTEPKFRYPYFELINWFAAQKIAKDINQLNHEEQKVPQYLLAGLKTLLTQLKQWNNEKDYNTNTRDQIPYNINPQQLIKDIAREIRHAERFINHLNPPKPERESKRKRRKPVNRDFVDYSLSPKASANDFIEEVMEPIPPIKLHITKTNNYTKKNDEKSWNNTNDVIARPEETTAIHRGGAVLKFKLGSKDLMRHMDIPNMNLSSSSSSSKSIYDFHDESDRDEDCFNISIDESPKKLNKKTITTKTTTPTKKITNTIKPTTLKVRFPVKHKKNNNQTVINNGVVVDGQIINNGIESLLDASIFHQGSPIAEDLNNVHQDEDYIYPSLDNSDDEDVHIFKPRGRSKTDEAWNPKARVGPLLPKMNRPAREGTKKQAVEKVLEAAAARRANEEPKEKTPKRQYRRKKLKPKVDIVKNLLTKSTTATISTNTTTTTTIIKTLSVPSTSTTISPPKPRKGMKTVKQRLGKLLKIHKMIH